MSNILFKGVYSATFSLYNREMNVIRPSVEKLIRYNLDNGISGFYVGGATGECMVLPNKTRMQMLETVKSCAGNAGIIAHIGAGHLEDTLALLDHANSVGVDAIASLPPTLTSYYNIDETLAYYRLLAEKSKSPVMAYVTPVLTGDPIRFATELMHIDNVIGIKLTIPNYYLFERMKLVNGGNINVLNGPDECMLAGLVMGADGAIGTNYNLIPRIACGIYNSFIKGDIKAAQEYQHRLNRLVDILIGNNMATWKVPLRLLDIDIGYTVAPAVMPSAEREKEILDALKKIGIADEFNH